MPDVSPMCIELADKLESGDDYFTDNPMVKARLTQELKRLGKKFSCKPWHKRVEARPGHPTTLMRSISGWRFDIHESDKVMSGVQGEVLQDRQSSLQESEREGLVESQAQGQSEI